MTKINFFDCANSPVIKSVQAGLQIADQALDQVNKSHQVEKIHLNQLAKKLSADTDAMILAFQRDEHLQFMGGELIAAASLSTQDNFTMTLKLYFQDPHGKTQLKEVVKNLSSSILTRESLDELMHNKAIRYEVIAPK